MCLNTLIFKIIQKTWIRCDTKQTVQDAVWFCQDLNNLCGHVIRSSSFYTAGHLSRANSVGGFSELHLSDCVVCGLLGFVPLYYK